MYLFELQQFVRTYIDFKNIFVIPSDHLPVNFNLPADFIINASESSDPGTHWLALWIDAYGTASYFDCYGFKPFGPLINRFIRLHSVKLNYNRKCLQQPSRVCGMYAATFLYYLSKGISLENYLKNFGLNSFVNDGFVENLFRSIQAKHKPRY